jgi:hypothetical protein
VWPTVEARGAMFKGDPVEVTAASGPAVGAHAAASRGGVRGGSTAGRGRPHPRGINKGPRDNSWNLRGSNAKSHDARTNVRTYGRIATLLIEIIDRDIQMMRKL